MNLSDSQPNSKTSQLNNMTSSAKYDHLLIVNSKGVAIYQGGASSSALPSEKTSEPPGFGLVSQNVTNLASTCLKKSKQAVVTRASAKQFEEPIYLIFANAAKISDDPLWITVFTKMSQGIFRRGWRFVQAVRSSSVSSDGCVGGILTCKNQLKEYSVTIPNDPEQAYQIAKDFMEKKGGISSEKDRINIERISKQRESSFLETLPKRWSDIRGIASQEALVLQFVKRISQKLKLTVNASNDLTSCIILGVASKFLGDGTIHLSCLGTIDQITGIVQLSNGKFVLDLQCVTKTALAAKHVAIKFKKIIQQTPRSETCGDTPDLSSIEGYQSIIANGGPLLAPFQSLMPSIIASLALPLTASSKNAPMPDIPAAGKQKLSLAIAGSTSFKLSSSNNIESNSNDLSSTVPLTESKILMTKNAPPLTIFSHAIRAAEDRLAEKDIVLQSDVDISAKYRRQMLESSSIVAKAAVAGLMAASLISQGKRSDLDAALKKNSKEMIAVDKIKTAISVAKTKVKEDDCLLSGAIHPFSPNSSNMDWCALKDALLLYDGVVDSMDWNYDQIKLLKSTSLSQEWHDHIFIILLNGGSEDKNEIERKHILEKLSDEICEISGANGSTTKDGTRSRELVFKYLDKHFRTRRIKISTFMSEEITHMIASEGSDFPMADRNTLVVNRHGGSLRTFVRNFDEYVSRQLAKCIEHMSESFECPAIGQSNAGGSYQQSDLIKEKNSEKNRLIKKPSSGSGETTDLSTTQTQSTSSHIESIRPAIQKLSFKKVKLIPKPPAPS